MLIVRMANPSTVSYKVHQFISLAFICQENPRPPGRQENPRPPGLCDFPDHPRHSRLRETIGYIYLIMFS